MGDSVGIGKQVNRSGYGIAVLMLATVLGFANSGPAFAQTAGKEQALGKELQVLLKDHKRIKAAVADLEAAKQSAMAARGDWFPTFDATGSWGYERQNKPSGTDDTAAPPKELNLTLTQQLWDFGSSNASIDSADLSVDQAQATLDATKQGLMFEAISAHLNVIKAKRLLDFAEGSVANIKRQAELEDARVQRGSGFSTDVLQAKTTLAGAEASRTQAQGQLRAALNRYRAVFGRVPDDISKLKMPRVPVELLPKSLDEAVELSLKGNRQLQATGIAADIAEKSVVQTRADEFFPTLNAIAQRNEKVDQGGTLGHKTENIIKVELTYSLNLGLTARNTLKASELSQSAATNRYGDARDQVEEQARNAWDSLQTAKENAKQLNNQANIAAAFLELARRERQLGNRSLIDVLSGETALINSSSQAASAETDVDIASFNLLNIMNKLTPAMFE